MQPVPADHPHGPVNISVFPGRQGADAVVAVALLVGLVDYVQPVIVIHSVHLGVVGIMAGADRVDVVALHQKDVLEHGFDRDRLSVDRVYVMPVSAFEISEDIVDIELVILELHFAEAVPEEGTLKGFPLFIKKLHLDRVEIWILG